MLNIKRVVVEGTDGKNVWMTPNQAEALSTLTSATPGGCSALHGYVPTSGYITSPVIDLQMITRFSYTKLLERKFTALTAVTFDDVTDAIAREPKLTDLSVEKQVDLFNTRKQKMLDSIDTTKSGDRSDAHRAAHDRCYVQFANGVKAHLVTEKDSNGIMQPVLLNGLPVVDNIMLGYIELNRKVIKAGERKVTNHGAAVLMDHAIESILNKRSVSYKTVSLKADNFDTLVMSKVEFLPENISPSVMEIL